jgi:hypothetical protein
VHVRDVFEIEIKFCQPLFVRLSSLLIILQEALKNSSVSGECVVYVSHKVSTICIQLIVEGVAT